LTPSTLFNATLHINIKIKNDNNINGYNPIIQEQQLATNRAAGGSNKEGIYNVIFT